MVRFVILAIRRVAGVEIVDSKWVASIGRSGAGWGGLDMRQKGEVSQKEIGVEGEKLRKRHLVCVCGRPCAKVADPPVPFMNS